MPWVNSRANPRAMAVFKVIVAMVKTTVFLIKLRYPWPVEPKIVLKFSRPIQWTVDV